MYAFYGREQMSKDGLTLREGERNDLRNWDQKAFIENFPRLVQG